MPTSPAYHYARSLVVFVLLFAEVTFIGALLAVAGGRVTWLQAGMVGITGLVSGCATFGFYLLLSERYWRLAEQLDGDPTYDRRVHIDTVDQRAMERYDNVTPRHDDGFYVVRPDGSRRLFPPLPAGVDWLDVESWIAATWYTRKQPARSEHKITFSERGAQRHGLARRWTQAQVGAVKEWIVERGWIVITNSDKGNWDWTEQGKWAAETLTAPDGPSLLQVAVADYPESGTRSDDGR